MRNASAYLCPESLDEAIALVQAQPGRAAYLAGGTVLAERDDPRVETLVDLAGLGLDGIASRSSGLRLGAMVSLERMSRDPAVTGVGDGVVGQALLRTRTASWRQQATLGGRLREACPGDLVATSLLALGATVCVQQLPHAPQETVPLESLGNVDLGALLVAVEIGTESGWSHVLESLHLTALDRPIVAVAVGLRLADGRIAGARVASCGLTPGPARATRLERQLDGAAVETDFEPWLRNFTSDVRPVGDLRGSAAYREHLGRVLLGRALRRLLVPAGKA